MKKNIEDFIFELLNSVGVRGIHRSGENFHCQCPFHFPKHNTSAFGISTNPDKYGIYRCFSCSETGNILTLICHIYKCSFIEARKILRKQVGISPINLEVLKESMKKIIGSVKYEVDKYPTIELPEKFSDQLMLEYLNKRNEEKQHGIMDVDYLISKYGLYYCDAKRYMKRIIMPIRAEDGRNIYFTNRSIDESRSKNLFPLNTDATKFIYGLYESLGKNKVFIFEGPFDVYQFKSYAIKNKITDYGFVACMGTVMSEYRASILSSHFEEAIICFDHDETGLSGIKKAKNLLSDFMKVRSVTELVYPGKDPANLTERQIKKVFKFRTQIGLNLPNSNVWNHLALA